MNQLNFGDLTDKEKIIKEERTSLFINLVGITAKEVAGTQDLGLSNRRMYKILANAIIDWSWLSYKYQEKYNFSGIGNLVWTPHKFGALGQVRPSIEYENIEIKAGNFALINDLFKSSLYSIYGYKGVTNQGDTYYHQFPDFISYEVQSKSPVGDLERYFWVMLVKIYAGLPDMTLDAMGSCRTRTLAFHSIWIQFIYWSRHMGFALDKVVRNPISMSNAKKEEIISEFKDASACIKQIYNKMEFYKNIETHIEKVREAAENTELKDFIPQVEELDPDFSNNYKRVTNLVQPLKALHDICREYQIRNGFDGKQKRFDITTIEENLRYLENSLELSPELTNLQKWSSLFLQEGNRKEAANQLLRLKDEVFDRFSKKVGFTFDSTPTRFYNEFLNEYYPLPYEHFLRGN